MKTHRHLVDSSRMLAAQVKEGSSPNQSLPSFILPLLAQPIPFNHLLSQSVSHAVRRSSLSFVSYALSHNKPGQPLSTIRRPCRDSPWFWRWLLRDSGIRTLSLCPSVSLSLFTSVASMAAVNPTVANNRVLPRARSSSCWQFAPLFQTDSCP